VKDFPLLTHWLLAQRPGLGRVRLTLTLPYGGHVDVLDDPGNKRLLVVPQLGPATPGPSPSAAARSGGWF
jgi:hypothetical protein